MSTEYVEGLGYITFDPNKTKQEKEDTIAYWKATTPKNIRLDFAKGWNDVESIAYRAFEKAFLNTEEEEKNQWFETQIKNIGDIVGFTDSIALENYYTKIKKSRELTKDEQKTRESNMAVMTEFKNDMFYAYENNSGDVTEVQKKYGYDPEDVSVWDGLQDMIENPEYTIGSLAAMLAKDPELLLLGYLGVPARIAAANKKLMQMANLATKIKPKYIKRFENTLGRGVEGAAYGVTYEALHDLTFNGHINPDNVERGAAMGALMGSAFGAVTNVSKGPLLDRLNSRKAQQKMWDGESSFENVIINGESVIRPKPPLIDRPTKTGEPLQPPKVAGEEVVIPQKHKSSAMPEGINYKNRYEFWLERMKTQERENVKPVIEEANPLHSKKGRTQEEIKQIEARRKANTEMAAKESEAGIVREINGLASTLMKRNPNMKIGEARAEAALRLGRDRPFDKPPNESRVAFSRRLEREKGKQDIKDKKETPPVETFKEGLRESTEISRLPVEGSSLVKAGLVGSAVGYYSFDENPIFAAVIGAGLGALTRGALKNVNIDKAKMKLSVSKKAQASKIASEKLEAEATMTIKNIKREFTTEAEQTSFLYSIEKGKKSKEYHNMTESQKNVVDMWNDIMKKFKRLAIKANVFEHGIEGEYVSHIFKNKAEISETWKQQFGDILKSKSKFGHQRKLLETIEELKAKGHDVVTDPIEILNIYTHSMTKAITGSLLTKSLMKSAVISGKKQIGAIILQTEKASEGLSKRLGYKTSDLPALRDKWIHPEILKSIEDFYRIDTGHQGFFHKTLVVNNAMKRLAVSASFFHAQALLLSMFYSGAMQGMLTPQGRVRLKRIKDAVEGRWEDGRFVEAELMAELAEHGIQIGHMKTASETNPGYGTIKNWFDKYLPRVSKGQDMVDFATWDFLHDRGKMYSYLLHKERAMSRGVGAKEAGAKAGQFVNDAFGGQNWNKLGLEFQEKALENPNSLKGIMYDYLALMTKPTKLKWANLGIFAPDWTVSNFRIVFKGFTQGKQLAEKLVKGKKLNPVEKAEFNMYSGYLVRSAVVTTSLAFMMHKFFADEDKEFDVMEFWKTGRLDIGNGQQMVVSKQIAEPMHWLTNPVHTGWNKSAAVPKMVIELLAGKEYASFKHGSLIGPPLDWDDPRAVVGYGLSKVTPISLGSIETTIKDKIIKDEDIDYGETIKKTFAGATGFPIYGKEKKKRIYR